MKAIETREYPAGPMGYNLKFKQMIVEHPEHGLILVSQGERASSIDGKIAFESCWESGFAVKISANDCFGKPEIDALTVLKDDNYPSLGWSGKEIASFAKSVEK